MIDTNLTLEQLENDYWGKPEYPSALVVNCHKYRKIPVKNLTAEQLRLLIGQNIGLKFLIPLAIEILKNDFLAEGDLFPGALLNNVLGCDTEYWKESPGQRIIVELLLKSNELYMTSESILDNELIQKSILKFRNG
jgi:hypothetical protein